MKKKNKILIAIIGILLVLIIILYTQFIVKYNNLLSIGLNQDVSRQAVLENKYQEVYDTQINKLQNELTTLKNEAYNYDIKYQLDNKLSLIEQKSYLEKLITKRKEDIKPVVKDGITYIDGLIIVNKKISLPSDYLPGENKEVKQLFLKLIKDMQDKGFSISDTYSGYRSYKYQQEVYNNSIKSVGLDETLRSVAKAGHSEHQLGITYDVLNGSKQTLGYNNRKSDLEAVEWLKNNAHHYGFIIRYPKGKEAITGYMHEPWHIRYVGDKAQEIYESNKCLEEYYHFEG